MLFAIGFLLDPRDPVQAPRKGRALAVLVAMTLIAVAVPAAPAQAATTPITVAMSSGSGDLAENGGTKDVTVALDRAPSAEATVTVPLVLRGAAPGAAFEVELHSSSDSGTVLDAGAGRWGARNPVLRFGAGARRAVLRFTGVDNDLRSQPVVWVSFGWGARAPHGDTDDVAVDPAHAPVVFAIADDETGPLQVPLDWPLRPDGVAAGETFRLLFVTSKGKAPNSTDIDFYNGLARSLVARSGHARLRPYAGMMRVLGSTSAVAARDNTGTNPDADGPGEPVHWLRGAKVADDYADLYDGQWDNYSGDATTENGTKLASWIRVWTGSTTVGTAEASGPLGNGPTSGGERLVVAAWNNHEDGTDPLSFASLEEVGHRGRANRFGHRYYVMSPVFTVESSPVTVTLSAAAGDVDEAAGTKDVTVALSRSLLDDETITVPLRVTGATAATDYTFELHGAHQGVTLLSDGARSASEPAVRFGTGARSAVLRFDPADNSMRTQPWVTIGYGSPAEAEGAKIAATEGGPISFAITDDETGDIGVPLNWSLKPSGGYPGSQFRLLFVTSRERDATSGNIADYDAFVRGLAAQGNHDIVPYAGFFKVLGGTSTVEAAAHVGIDPDGFMDVYWLGGHDDDDRVAVAYRRFLAHDWRSESRQRPRDELGALVGVDSDGYWSSGLGAPTATVGYLDSGTHRISGGHEADPSTARSLFALSPVFTVAPIPTASITAGPRVDEGSAATFTIHVTSAPSSDLKIDLLVDDSSFVSRLERGVRRSAVTIAAGQTSAPFSVATVDDSHDERDGAATVFILSGAGYQISTTAHIAAVDVNDDDPTTVRLAAHGTGTVIEGSTKDLSVTLSRMLVAGESVTVPLIFAGTAARGSDYSVRCSGTAVTCTGLDGGEIRVVFGAGARTATVTVAVTPDDVDPEPAKTVDVGLGTVTTTGLADAVTGIVDDAGPFRIVNVAIAPPVVTPPVVEPPPVVMPPTRVVENLPVLTFKRAAATALESAGIHYLVIDLNPIAEATFTLHYAVEGSASPGADFAPLTGSSLVLPFTYSLGIPVKIDDDRALEPTETLVVSLLDGEGYRVGGASTHTLTIIDND